MVEQPRAVYGGVDTHKELHVAAALDEVGRVLGAERFNATAAGYRALLVWMARHGQLARVGIEGTGSYGAGLARHLSAAGIELVEVNRPNRQMRRRRGKNDTVDAEAAARAALNGDATAVPKAGDGTVEAIRATRVAFASTRATRTRVANQMRDLVVTAPARLRANLEVLNTTALAQRAARYRPGDVTDPTEATKAALRTLARQHQILTADLDELRDRLDELTAQANPALRDAVGIGPDVASILLAAAGDNPHRITSDAAFAALCGASPIEASSGKHVSHRLNKGGNRDANHALWRIAMVRMTCHQPTKDYVTRRRAEGKSQRFIIRCLKRYIAREVFHLLTTPPATPHNHQQLRTTRIAAGLSLTDVATALGTWPARISELERGTKPNTNLAPRYRDWLNHHLSPLDAP